MVTLGAPVAQPAVEKFLCLLGVVGRLGDRSLPELTGNHPAHRTLQPHRDVRGDVLAHGDGILQQGLVELGKMISQHRALTACLPGPRGQCLDFRCQFGTACL